MCKNIVSAQLKKLQCVVLQKNHVGCFLSSVRIPVRFLGTETGHNSNNRHRKNCRITEPVVKQVPFNKTRGILRKYTHSDYRAGRFVQLVIRLAFYSQKTSKNAKVSKTCRKRPKTSVGKGLDKVEKTMRRHTRAKVRCSRSAHITTQ